MARRLIALRLPPSSLDAALHRVWADGDAVLPLPVDAPEDTIDRLVERLRPAAIETLGPDGTAVRAELDDAPAVPEDTALVVATSGSTGEPRGVVLSHRALTASIVASVARLGCERGDRWLLVLPVHHVAGIQVLLRSWHLGVAPVVHDRFDPDTFARAAAEHVSLVPTQLVRLLEAGVDVSRFRTILLGGAKPDPRLLREVRRAGAHVVVSYGMTETCGGCVYDGYPLDGVETRVDLDGRILVRGSVLADGYRGPDGGLDRLTDDNGWFLTNDLGRLELGRLEVTGRADDVIVSGGETVPAAAAADALRSHPAVADAAVIGRDDEVWGEAVVAVVVPADPSSPPDLDVLRAHVRARHPAPYAPRDIVVVPELPRDDMGKVTKAALRDLVTR